MEDKCNNKCTNMHILLPLHIQTPYAIEKSATKFSSHALCTVCNVLSARIKNARQMSVKKQNMKLYFMFRLMVSSLISKLGIMFVV